MYRALFLLLGLGVLIVAGVVLGNAKFVTHEILGAVYALCAVVLLATGAILDGFSKIIVELRNLQSDMLKTSVNESATTEPKNPV